MRLKITDGVSVASCFSLKAHTIEGKHTTDVICCDMMCLGVFCKYFIVLIVNDMMLQYDDG